MGACWVWALASLPAGMALHTPHVPKVILRLRLRMTKVERARQPRHQLPTTDHRQLATRLHTCVLRAIIRLNSEGVGTPADFMVASTQHNSNDPLAGALQWDYGTAYEFLLS